VSSRAFAALSLALCLLGGWSTRPAFASLAAPSIASAAPGPSPRPIASTGADHDEDIRDIHGPIDVPRRHPRWWYLAGAGGLSLAAASLAVYARRRKRRAPPHVRALEALAALQSSPGTDARTFSFAVSEIVRRYVEEAFAVRAAHRTTEELLADLMLDTSPVAAHRTAVGEFLRHCDLAKFAGWSLSQADMAALLASAETFVLATAPVAPSQNLARAAALRGEGVA
jgi:hypothetical protein